MTKIPTIYQAKNGAIELKSDVDVDVDVDVQTIWANQKDLSVIFDTEKKCYH